jgi:hypothetical protein
METVRSSETSVYIYETIRPHTEEDSNRQIPEDCQWGDLPLPILFTG